MLRKRMVTGHLVLWVALLLVLPSCTTWSASAGAPGAVIPADAPEAVRVTTRSGAVATIRAPLVRNDSIVSSEPAQPAILLSDVAGFEVRQFSGVRTVGLAAAGVAGAALWTAVIASTGGSGEDPDPVPKLSPNLFSGVAWLGRLLLGR